MANRETAIMQAIHRALVESGKVLVWRNNVGSLHGTMHASSGRRFAVNITYGLGVGSADIIGIIIGTGRMFALEVKTEDGALSPNQRAWHKCVRDAGGFVAVARTIDEAIAALDRAMAGGAE